MWKSRDPSAINTFTCPTIKLDWQLPQHLTLHELKYALTRGMNIYAHSIILKRRTAIVGLWTRLTVSFCQVCELSYQW